MTGTITLNNEFTVNQVSEVVDRLKSAIKANDEVIVELTDVESIDVAALQTLIAAKKECRRIGRRVIFRMSDTAKNISSLIGIQL